MHVISQNDAVERADLIAVESYEVELDLTTGAERFGSVSRIRFSCRAPGASSFVEILAPVVRSVELNGRSIEPASIVGERIPLADLLAENELTVVAECAYSTTGEGLHRFEDPADGEVYLHSQSFLYDAHRIFACFDQPDLKASVALTVTAPEPWTVLANGAGTCVEAGRWTFERTLAISTYIVAIVAGRYHSVHSEHDGIPLGLHCRQSLAPYLEADEILEGTRQSFDHYHGLFGIPYPFGKYDQVFVPEFNAGAMENAGCVTFADEFVFRSRVTDASRQTRIEVVAHEMAHMWFGDLVTMRWWDDLWLNESFADYMAHLTLAQATRFRDAWTTFCSREKAWGYEQDQLPSTHPISGPVADSEAALLNFDGISYAKGAAVLKQLVAWVGFDQFRIGLRDYLTTNSYANATLADLLDALGRASGRELSDWSRSWLETAGVNTLRPDVTVRSGGDRYERVVIEQTAPAEWPTLRAHRIAIGLYDRDGERLVRRDRVELDVVGARTEVTALAGVSVPDLLLVNDEDHTWAKIRLDRRSMATVLDGGIGRLDDSLPRALLWAAIWDLTRDAELRPGDYVRLVLDGIVREADISVVEDLLRHARETIDELGLPERREARLGSMAARSLEILRDAEPGGDVQLAHARTFGRAGRTPAEVSILEGWLTDRDVPEGLAVDVELRWLLVRSLAILGAMGERGIAAELARDSTSAGEEHAAFARASRPEAPAKAAAWSALLDADTLSNHLVAATARGFWQPEQLDLGRPYVERYFETMPRMWRERTHEIAMSLSRHLFPAVLVEPATVARTDAALATPGIDPRLRRVLLEQRAKMVRALAARARDLD
ncbi:MAG: aminopeptidase N [Chloroflexi bacterium]|nr:aminopeptidase N [Chloroflexota bacterium]